jgi:hypothetical protein
LYDISFYLYAFKHVTIMFKKTSKEPQLDIFSNVSSLLPEIATRKYNDNRHWHNQFRLEVVNRIDETPYKVLFNQTMGAPNAPIRVLLGMMILKEAFGWSDSQLFEYCQFNLLTRSALGLLNMNDPLPADSTYYLLRQRIYKHNRSSGEDLLEKTFAHITREQVKFFDVNGRSIRMDSKLIGSNIAYFSRYEIIHGVLAGFYKAIKKQAKFRLSASDIQQLDLILSEEPGKTIYRNSKEEVKERLQGMGLIIHKLLTIFQDEKSEGYGLLQRVFEEQYKVAEDQQIQLRPKEEIASGSIQSPHDPDSAFRQKGDHKVKGYSVNITETTSEQGLDLITSVIVEPANTADKDFVQPAIESSCEVTGQKVEAVFLDGAFQSPDNDRFCQNIDMVFTGIQGGHSRYDLEMTTEGLMVTDTQTGECTLATKAKKQKNSKEDSWSIKTSTGRVYFSQRAIRTSHLRKTMYNRPIEETHKRNNVEATIFQFGFPLKNNKTKYRGLFKQKIWSYCRCLWVNLVRIINFAKQTCQRTIKAMEMQVKLAALVQKVNFPINFQPNLNCQFPKVIFLSIINFISLFKTVPF